MGWLMDSWRASAPRMFPPSNVPRLFKNLSPITPCLNNKVLRFSECQHFLLCCLLSSGLGLFPYLIWLSAICPALLTISPAEKTPPILTSAKRMYWNNSFFPDLYPSDYTLCLLLSYCAWNGQPLLTECTLWGYWPI